MYANLHVHPPESREGDDGARATGVRVQSTAAIVSTFQPGHLRKYHWTQTCSIPHEC